MADVKEKGTWRPKYKSEFSMGELDFHRYDFWLKKADLSSADIDSTDLSLISLEQIKIHFSNLNVLYKNWNPLISNDRIRKEIGNNIKKAKHLRMMWENSESSGLPFSNKKRVELIEILDEIHLKLLEVKQVIGLGIVVKKVMTTSQKIKMGLNPKIDLDNLPEA